MLLNGRWAYSARERAADDYGASRLQKGEHEGAAGESCLNCGFVTDDGSHAHCVKHSVQVNPWYLCDEQTSGKMVAGLRLKEIP